MSLRSNIIVGMRTASIATVPGTISVQHRNEATMDDNNNIPPPILNCVDMLKERLTTLTNHNSRDQIRRLIFSIIEKEELQLHGADMWSSLGGLCFLFTKQRLRKLLDESVCWEVEVMTAFCNFLVEKVNALDEKPNRELNLCFWDDPDKKKFVVPKKWQRYNAVLCVVRCNEGYALFFFDPTNKIVKVLLPFDIDEKRVDGFYDKVVFALDYPGVKRPEKRSTRGHSSQEIDDDLFVISETRINANETKTKDDDTAATRRGAFSGLMVIVKMWQLAHKYLKDYKLNKYKSIFPDVTLPTSLCTMKSRVQVILVVKAIQEAKVNQRVCSSVETKFVKTYYPLITKGYLEKEINKCPNPPEVYKGGECVCTRAHHDDSEDVHDHSGGDEVAKKLNNIELFIPCCGQNMHSQCYTKHLENHSKCPRVSCTISSDTHALDNETKLHFFVLSKCGLKVQRYLEFPDEAKPLTVIGSYLRLGFLMHKLGKMDILQQFETMTKNVDKKVERTTPYHSSNDGSKAGGDGSGTVDFNSAASSGGNKSDDSAGFDQIRNSQLNPKFANKFLTDKSDDFIPNGYDGSESQSSASAFRLLRQEHDDLTRGRQLRREQVKKEREVEEQLNFNDNEENGSESTNSSVGDGTDSSHSYRNGLSPRLPPGRQGSNFKQIPKKRKPRSDRTGGNALWELGQRNQAAQLSDRRLRYKVATIPVIPASTIQVQTSIPSPGSPITNSTMGISRKEVMLQQAKDNVEIYQAGGTARKGHGLATEGSKKIVNPHAMPWIVKYGGVYFSTSSERQATRFGLCLVKHFKKPIDMKIKCQHCDKTFPSRQRLNIHTEQRIYSGKCVDCSHFDDPKYLKHFRSCHGPWTYWVEDKLIDVLFFGAKITGDPEDLIDPTQHVYSRSDLWFISSELIQSRSQAAFQRLNLRNEHENNPWLKYIRLSVKSQKDLMGPKSKSDAEEKAILTFNPQPWFYNCCWLKPYPIWPDKVKAKVEGNESSSGGNIGDGSFGSIIDLINLD